MDIDIVVTWVDMDDPKWQADFAQYGTINNTRNEVSAARFRDYGFLKYWFRGVEKFAPWVRKIHFVTCGQKPQWLDEHHPKLNLVSHADFIPHEFLPTFNSPVIERYMHRIPGLADRFVYFNDDFYITNHVPVERFFAPNGLPMDIAAFRLNLGEGMWGQRVRNSVGIINRRFDKREVLRRDHAKWFHPSYGSKSRLTRWMQPYGKFLTLRVPHNAQPYLKSTFEEVWDYAGNELRKTSANRLRSADDYSPELFRVWQICRSNFEPYNTYADTKMFPLLLKSEQAIEAVQTQKYKLVCLNDNARMRNYARVMQRLQAAFEHILPTQSAFEK